MDFLMTELTVQSKSLQHATALKGPMCGRNRRWEVAQDVTALVFESGICFRMELRQGYVKKNDANSRKLVKTE